MFSTPNYVPGVDRTSSRWWASEAAGFLFVDTTSTKLDLT